MPPVDVLPQTDQTVPVTVRFDPIESLRIQIDGLDDAIAHLVMARMRLSLQIQTARVNAGGPRIVLSRERAIRQRYLEALGSAGFAVADTMLRLCRGSG
jgi:chorismate mutase